MSQEIKVGDHVEWDSRYFYLPHPLFSPGISVLSIRPFSPLHPFLLSPLFYIASMKKGRFYVFILFPLLPFCLCVLYRQGHSVGVVEEELTHDKKVLSSPPQIKFYAIYFVAHYSE